MTELSFTVNGFYSMASAGGDWISAVKPLEFSYSRNADTSLLVLDDPLFEIEAKAYTPNLLRAALEFNLAALWLQAQKDDAKLSESGRIFKHEMLKAFRLVASDTDATEQDKP